MNDSTFIIEMVRSWASRQNYVRRPPRKEWEWFTILAISEHWEKENNSNICLCIQPIDKKKEAKEEDPSSVEFMDLFSMLRDFFGKS